VDLPTSLGPGVTDTTRQTRGVVNDVSFLFADQMFHVAMSLDVGAEEGRRFTRFLRVYKRSFGMYRTNVLVELKQEKQEL
jgi:hypothetical protein